MADPSTNPGASAVLGADPLAELHAEMQAGQQAVQQRNFARPAAGQVVPSQPATKITPPAATPAKPSGGGLSGVLDWLNPFTPNLGAQAKTISAAIVRAPGQLIGGGLDTQADAGKFIADNIAAGGVRRVGANLALGFPGVLPLVGSGIAARNMNNGQSLADTMSFRQQLGNVGTSPQANQNITNGIAIGLSLFTPGGAAKEAPVVAGVGAKVLAGAAKLLGSSAKVGLASAAVADPRAENLANVFKGTPMESPLTDYLSANPNDPALVNRAKAALEGAVTNFVAEPALKGVFMGLAQAIKGSGIADSAMVQQGIADFKAALPKAKPPITLSEATPAEAATDNLDRTFATQRTDAARFQQAQAAQEAQGAQSSSAAKPDDATASAPGPQGQEILTDGGTRHSDATGTPEAAAPEGPQEHPVATDANAALEQAGVAERVDPVNPPIRQDGKITVAPATKDAADAAGVGRPFAAAGTPDEPTVAFKAEGPDGSARVVGTMGRKDLQSFVDEAADIRDHHIETGESLNLPADSAHGQWKLNFNASYDVAPLLRAIIERIPGFGRPRPDEELMKAAIDMAKPIGESAASMLQSAATFAGHTADLDTAMAAHRLVWTQMARALDDHIGMDLSTYTKGQVQDLGQAIANMMNFTTALEEAKTGIARALRVNALPDAETYLANLERVRAGYGSNGGPPMDLSPVAPGGMPPLPRTPAELQQWVDLWGATANNPEARQAFLKGLTVTPERWVYLRSSFANFFTASIVSGPVTFMRDLAGPAAVGALRTLERTAGGFAASLNPMIDAQARDELRTAASQSPLAYLHGLGDVVDAFKWAVQKGGSSMPDLTDPLGFSPHGPAMGLNGHNPIDFNAQGIPRAMVQAATAKDALPFGDIPYLLGNLINKWPQAVHALHGGVNEFAQRLSYLGEIRAQAMLEGSQMGLSPENFSAMVRSRLQNSTDPVLGHGLDEAALASSQRTTFIKPATDQDPKAFQAFSKFVQTLRTQVPETRYILPIFTVPANAIGETLRRVPILNLAFSQTRAELAGEAGPIAQAEAYGRTLLGGAFLTGSALMARNGILTGAGPTEPNARKLWLQTHEPYSINIGGNWVSYNRLDAVGPLLGIAGSVYDRSVYHADDSGASAYAGVAALAEYFKDQAALQGVSDLLSFGGSPGESKSIADQFMKQTASGFVPNFITQWGRNNLDPLQRTTRSPFEAILNKLPGASDTLDPQRNLLGEDVYKVQNAGFNTLPISMAPSGRHDDPVMNELARLYEQTGYAPGVLSPAASGQAHFDLRDVKLEDGHSLYDALMRSRQVSQVDGQTLREALKTLISGPEYREAVDGSGRTLTDDLGNTSRGALIQRTFDAFNRQAKSDVAKESPTAARWLATAAAKNTDSAILRPYSAHDLASTPNLFHALGVPIQDYEDKIKDSGQ